MIDKARFLYVEWLITFGCNFRCNYCFFGKENLIKNAYMFRQRGPRVPHAPLEKKLFRLARDMKLFDYADSLRNYPIEKWQALFAYLATFKRDLYLSFTGGEPMILEKPIVEILNAVYARFDKVVIRFDTNGSIVPKFEGLTPRADITFNVSYHPTEISRDKLVANLKRLSDKGRVLMVNRVFNHRELPQALDEIRYFADLGYFMNFSPESFDISEYSEAELETVAKLRAPSDVELPLFEQTTGRRCDFPTFGFQLLPNGYAWIPPCDRKTADIINKPSRIHKLLKPAAIACPGKCVCLHQYPWVNKGYDDMDILGAYVARNVAWRKKQLVPVA